MYTCVLRIHMNTILESSNNPSEYRSLPSPSRLSRLVAGVFHPQLFRPAASAPSLIARDVLVAAHTGYKTVLYCFQYFSSRAHTLEEWEMDQKERGVFVERRDEKDRRI